MVKIVRVVVGKGVEKEFMHFHCKGFSAIWDCLEAFKFCKDAGDARCNVKIGVVDASRVSIEFVDGLYEGSCVEKVFLDGIGFNGFTCQRGSRIEVDGVEGEKVIECFSVKVDFGDNLVEHF